MVPRPFKRGTHMPPRSTHVHSCQVLDRIEQTDAPNLRDTEAHAAARRATLKSAATPPPTEISTTWVETDQEGRILRCAPAASNLLGYSERAATGRLLPILFLDNRPTDAHFQRVMLGHPVDRVGLFRPREQRSIRVVYRIELAPHSRDDYPILRWTLARQ